MNILIVSPHADDETLGAGGYLLKLKEQGHDIFWLNITDMSEAYGYSNEDVSRRQNQLELVAKAYDFTKTYNLGLRPAGLGPESTRSLIEQISSIVEEIKPHTMILPYPHDIHSDHKYVFEAAFACSKVFRYPFIKRILAMEILSETNFASPNDTFAPNYFVNVGSCLQKKIEIFSLYESECGKHPFPRSELAIRSQAILRGVQAGCEFAEAFKVLKWIENEVTL